MKNCIYCGNVFVKNKRYSWKQWEATKYCSKKCALIALGRNPDKSIDDRFWAKVSIPEEKTECWLWTGFKDKNGYGRISNRDTKMSLSHRYSYELKFGNIPDGFMVRHVCNNPMCVNPDHLKIGTSKDNSQDCNLSGRQGHKGTKFNLQLACLTYLAANFGVPTNQISIATGVSRATVRRIANKEVWEKELKIFEGKLNDLLIKE